MEKETTLNRKRHRWFVCDVCGHEWRSYGYGKRIICPFCYEARTGKKLGKSDEEMKEMREMRSKISSKQPQGKVEQITLTEIISPKQPKQEPPNNVQQLRPVPNPPPTAAEEEKLNISPWEKFLDRKIFR